MNKIKIRNNGELDYDVIEAFDKLRVNISFADKGAKSIAVTSASDKEGKSLISFQLACNMAANDKRVLLIMADFRKGIRGESKDVLGLTDALSGKAGLNDAVFKTDTHNLYIMFAGKEPQEAVNLLEGQTFDNMMDVFKNKFDYIITDTSSVNNSAETSLICSKCDGTILVVEKGETSYEKAYAAKQQIELAGGQILGTVINNQGK